MSEGSSEPDLERTLLGAVLVTPELLGAAADIVTPADFAKHAHGVIWTALLRLNEDDRPLDATSLKHELAELGQLAAAGGAAYLGELLDGVPRGIGEPAVLHWSRRIREAARLRYLLHAIQVAAGQAEAGGLTADELQGSLERLLIGEAVPSAAVLDREEVAASSWRAIEAEVRGEVEGISTGLPDLDRRLRCGGWRPGQLVLVGARTGRASRRSCSAVPRLPLPRDAACSSCRSK